MGRLFGTDGARGVANSELTCELAMQIGRAAAMVLIDENKKRPQVMIGMDTRISSNMLCSAITAGLCSVGADVMHLGVLPTPAVAYLVKKYNYDVVGIYLDTPLEVAFAQNKMRERVVPEDVIERMHNDLQKPEIKEGFDNIIQIYSSPLNDAKLYVSITKETEEYIDIDEHKSRLLDLVKDSKEDGN